MVVAELAPVVVPQAPAATSALPSVDAHFELPSDLPGLPAGFPVHLDCDLAWTGRQLANRSEHVLQLSAAELQEIHSALVGFKKLGLDGDLVGPANFPLPSLGPKLESMSQDLHDGRGFSVVRGLDPRKYPVEDLSIIHLGIQAYVANRAGRQDKRGNMMVHILADDKSKAVADHHRHSTASITFHNEESGDIVSWLTRSKAASGGKCIIASAYTVYNVLAATRPDMIRALAGSDWPFAMPKFHCRPVIFHHEGRIIMNFGRAPLLGNAAHPRKQGLPAVTARQLEALDAIEAVAKATQLELQTEAGDIHFINNLAVLHRREAFVDGGAKRHLVRMRLRSDRLGWAIPPALHRDWHDAFEREGDRLYHLQPMPEGFFPLRSNPN